jgi:glyoxylase-like metal-dependent hydrolase (beta-lactamase superfamily II)/ferredoxin
MESIKRTTSSNSEESKMADLKKRLPANVAGEFYVDSTCIDWDACRQLAPAVFASVRGFSAVTQQPATAEQTRAAQQALVACPTGSIGMIHKGDIADAISDFPLRLEQDVSYCGFNSPKSYGGNSYFVQHDDGNWLIDSPRYTSSLITALERRGGVRYIFLSHRDDVADAAKFAKHFQSERIIHEHELSSQPGSEIVIAGFETVQITPEFLVIPTPGHTRGHCCLLYSSKFLFTGDHLDWDRDKEQLDASRDYCWYSWPQQVESVERLREHSFEWVLPGHGQRVKLPLSEMQEQLKNLIERIHTVRT